MSNWIQLVKDFIEGERTAEGLAAAVQKHCTDDCVWQNSGRPEVRTKSSMLDLLGSVRAHGIASIQVELHHIAESTTGAVLTERLDHVYRADGSLIFSLPIMGIFEIRDDQIAAWRDYYNPVEYMQAVMDQV